MSFPQWRVLILAMYEALKSGRPSVPGGTMTVRVSALTSPMRKSRSKLPRSPALILATEAGPHHALICAAYRFIQNRLDRRR